jgi:hypothetical protein
MAPPLDVFSLWPRRRSTAAALTVLIVLQAILFFTVTQSTFFLQDDYNYFKLAQERSFLRYLFSPVLGLYPAPGNRLASFLLQQIFPLNYAAARTFLLALLAVTTILLGQFVRTLARSDQWWTVALLVPFALSITLVVFPWWSAVLPIVPALLLTVVALFAWLRSYTDPQPAFWVWVAVIAVAAAGAFYMKFLLIPVYLLLFRLAIFPRLLKLPVGIRSLWTEWKRWVAVGIPPALFIAVFVLSGLASRSAVSGSRPYFEYFATAWFRAFIPAAFMNARFDSSASSLPPWLIIFSSQVLFWGLVGATWRRSSLALRGWALFVFVFVVNAGMIGTSRLPLFGVEIAYALRYYPEVVLFLPLTLALALRQGEERRPELAWERTNLGQAAIALIACMYVVSFAIWAPGLVRESGGVQAKSWYDNLRHDIRAVMVHEAAPGIVDAETPQYVIENWMEPRNRISTILPLVPLDVAYNRLSERTYLVLDDGHLAEAAFRPTSLLLSRTIRGEGVRVLGGGPVQSEATCMREGGALLYRPAVDVTGERLAIRVFYAGKSRGPVTLEVNTGDLDRPIRNLELRPFQNDAELVDLSTSRVRALTLELSRSDEVCIERMEIGSLTAAARIRSEAETRDLSPPFH